MGYEILEYIQWDHEFSNLRGKRKLVSEIEFEKLELRVYRQNIVNKWFIAFT